MFEGLPKPRGRPADVEAQGRTEALIDASTKVFLTHGYATSIDRIAREARVSTKTIYHHFGGKAGLFGAAIRRLVDHQLADPTRPGAWDGPPSEVLPGFARRVFYGASTPTALGLQRIVVAEAARFPELASAFYDAGPARGIAILATYLAEQARLGRLVVPDPPIAAEQFVYMAIGDALRRGLFGFDPPMELAAIERRISLALRTFLAAHATCPSDLPDP